MNGEVKVTAGHTWAAICHLAKYRGTSTEKARASARKMISTSGVMITRGVTEATGFSVTTAIITLIVWLTN